jgi:hypothetical protein
MPYQFDNVLTAWTANSGKPILDRPLTSTGPSHNDFDGLMSRTQFAFQSICHCPGIRPKIFAVWKNYALFRQHSADPPQLWAVGDEYPGIFEGAVFSVDTQGGIADEAGRLERATPALQRIIDTRMRRGGRFAVTPSRRFLLKMERSTGDSKIIFLGVGPDPLFSIDTEQAISNDVGSAALAIGALYPFSTEKANRFAVLQRDARLIALKERGTVRFVVSPEKIPDPEKATQLRKIIAHLRETYQSGKQISKVFVTVTGDVIYHYRGSYYFAGKAPEGRNGFLFE